MNDEVKYDDFIQEILDSDFLSKRDFDFSDPKQFREYVKERTQAGSLSDGFQYRDLATEKLFEGIYASKNSFTREFKIRFIMSPSVQASRIGAYVYVLHPDENWDDKVSSFTFVKVSNTRGEEFSVEMGGPTKDGRPYFGNYFIIAASEKLTTPPPFLLKRVNNTFVKEAGKALGKANAVKMIVGALGFINYEGASYFEVSVKKKTKEGWKWEPLNNTNQLPFDFDSLHSILSEEYDNLVNN